MKLETQRYIDQQARWPTKGRIILAQNDSDSIVVYQAYRPAIGNFAAQHGYFGGEFSLERMSWIKPNFLWMMYRSGWGTKEGQAMTLAIRLQRSAFENILAQAVHSKYISTLHADISDWNKALKSSDVRLQWDPDHCPQGNKLDRRAIQLGLRGPTLISYAKDWIIEIEDISDFVEKQRKHVMCQELDLLVIPKEEVYEVGSVTTAQSIRLEEPSYS